MRNLRKVFGFWVKKKASVQLIVQELGRQVEEVTYALQDARHPPEVLLEDLQRVKLLLHEVWALRRPKFRFQAPMMVPIQALATAVNCIRNVWVSKLKVVYSSVYW